MNTLSRRNFLHGSALIGVSVAAAAMTPMAAVASRPQKLP